MKKSNVIHFSNLFKSIKNMNYSVDINYKCLKIDCKKFRSEFCCGVHTTVTARF